MGNSEGYPEILLEKGQDFLNDTCMKLKLVKNQDFVNSFCTQKSGFQRDRGSKTLGVFWENNKKEGIVGKF